MISSSVKTRKTKTRFYRTVGFYACRIATCEKNACNAKATGAMENMGWNEVSSRITVLSLQNFRME